MMRQHGARGAHPSTELAALTSRWEELELTLDAFNERIEDQMAHLRGQVRVRVRVNPNPNPNPNPYPNPNPNPNPNSGGSAARQRRRRRAPAR